MMEKLDASKVATEIIQAKDAMNKALGPLANILNENELMLTSTIGSFVTYMNVAVDNMNRLEEMIKAIDERIPKNDGH